ncbi:B18 subunit of NADH:ubiquinone oxidoreductase [Desarmillaria tabescens]|uniref:NADH dehydrogenase [ubiquinone] 1 beta subcomplex subunit 7 n=1 Tax=Armillaria tabescens TaxID=1929756 RepID=A0AA39JYK0_ARMTA|nr:B18 subunit of NADH:ubiquinone oxidoreductase [Desarmillaria tabescens]KAK0449844.1 B18 subunit of NADH:ubiquinone oxidoreductase [Desarmillaria tabescens]
MPSSTTASQSELKANAVPLHWRDSCSALLIPLNVCRTKNNYLPWECEHEKHAYEKCQYDDYLRRMKELAKLKAQAQAEE